MPKLNIDQLVKQMQSAALGVFKENVPSVKRYVETEFKKLGDTILMIEKAKLAGEIDEQEARTLIDMQKNAMRSVMLTVEGLGIVMVEKAINAALRIVKDVVNSGIGFKLL